MKKTVLLTLSHLLVAVLAAFLALQLTPAGLAHGADSKLEQLEKLILERFIGEADQTAMEDAAALKPRLPNGRCWRTMWA